LNKTPIRVDSSVVQNCEQSKCNLLSMGFFWPCVCSTPMLQGHWGWEFTLPNCQCIGTEYSGMNTDKCLVKVTCMEAGDQPAHKSVMTEMIYSNSWVWACHKCPIRLNYTGQACGKVEPTLVLSPSGARLLGYIGYIGSQKILDLNHDTLILS
jgi:hypothetical protein